MKKPSSKIRENIARLQEELKQAETREAERLGKIALKAGLGEVEIDESELHAAFGDIAARFHNGRKPTTARQRTYSGQGASSMQASIPVDTPAGSSKEA
jgi:hypothetical protein